ncbi:hypothetical protein KC325_g68 [Hortaea werneckii]|nr:hypothetical protein KC325_g68 [Hortaea werneckii]
MASSFPYTHYACPCTSLTASPPSLSTLNQAVHPTDDAEEDGRTFNPHSARANYALYPLDQLLYCDECDGIRCPKCRAAQCGGTGTVLIPSRWQVRPQLLPMSRMYGSDEGDGGKYLKPDAGAKGEERYLLQCLYCDWSTLDLDLVFHRPTKMTEQLAKHRKARTANANANANAAAASDSLHLQHESGFQKLQAFYQEQLTESSDAHGSSGGYGNSPYGSPANLQRIISLYGGLSADALKKSREKAQPMREARSADEGFNTYPPSISATPNEDPDTAILARLRDLSWDETASPAQRLTHPLNTSARFKSHLWPIATRLRTRKGKRCKTCRQFVSRPDREVSRLKYKIRMPASQHIPRLLFRPLYPPTLPSAIGPGAALAGKPDFRLKVEDLQPAPPLAQGITQQYVLTVKNPIFEPVKINLATPAVTPGKVGSRVTILCPSFTVGPAGDVWDEALSSTTAGTATTASTDASQQSGAGGGREAAMASLTGKGPNATSTGAAAAAGTGDDKPQPEAGKVWDRTRNSTSIILEITPGFLDGSSQQRRPSVAPTSQQAQKPPQAAAGEGTRPEQDADDVDDEETNDDADILEIPIFVRAEWDEPAEEGGEEKGGRLASSRGDDEGEMTKKKDLLPSSSSSSTRPAAAAAGKEGEGGGGGAGRTRFELGYCIEEREEEAEKFSQVPCIGTRGSRREEDHHQIFSAIEEMEKYSKTRLVSIFFFFGIFPLFLFLLPVSLRPALLPHRTIRKEWHGAGCSISVAATLPVAVCCSPAVSNRCSKRNEEGLEPGENDTRNDSAAREEEGERRRTNVGKEKKKKKRFADNVIRGDCCSGYRQIRQLLFRPHRLELGSTARSRSRLFDVDFGARKDERNVGRKKLLVAQRGVVEKVRVGKEIPDGTPTPRRPESGYDASSRSRGFRRASRELSRWRFGHQLW